MPAVLFRKTLLPVVMLVLSGCAAFTQVATPTLDWEARRSVLSALSGWHASGRVAMQTADDAWSASIDWNQAEGSYVIRLSGPLGGNMMTINGGPGYVVMETAEGEKFIETNVDRLIEAQTGWQIPVEGLKYWALALVDPGIPADRIFDDQGRLSQIRQSGWVIHYQAYQIKGNIEMPRKIQLDNDHFKVKLVIKDWQLGLKKS